TSPRATHGCRLGWQGRRELMEGSACYHAGAEKKKRLLDARASTAVSDAGQSASDPRHPGAVSGVGSASGVVTQPPTTYVMRRLFPTGHKRRYTFRASESRWH